MKKQNISVVSYLMGGGTSDVGNAAYDQLLAQQDIVYNFIPEPGSGDLPWKSIVPYHAVNFAVISRESETVEAPTDAICEGAEPAGRLVVTPIEPLPSLILNNEGESCTVNTGFGITATFDGVELTEAQLWTGMTFEVVGATYDQGLWVLPVDCDALSVTYTTVYTYEGETCSVTVTQSIGLG